MSRGAHAQMKQLTQKNAKMYAQIRTSIEAKRAEEARLAENLRVMQQQHQQQLIMQQQQHQPQAQMDHSARLFMEQQRMIQQQQQMLQQQLLQQQQALAEAQARANQAQQAAPAAFGAAGGSVYVPAPWSALPLHAFALELTENGRTASVPLVGKPYFVIGRGDGCEVQLQTPSVSRQHAVIQHRGGGSLQGGEEMYIYDLASASGTFVNGQRLLPRTYYALLVDDKLNFGDSPPFIVRGSNPQQQHSQLQQQHAAPAPQAAPAAAPATGGTNWATMDEDRIEALLHAKANTALVKGIQALDDQLARRVILEDEYYKRKCILQEKITKQQEALRQKILQKKKEARIKQSLEDKASHQRARQKAMKEERARAAAAAAGVPSASTEAPAATAGSSGDDGSSSGSGYNLDDAFGLGAKKKTLAGRKGAASSGMATMKLNPKDASFDPNAYKKMMVHKYELEQETNALLLAIRNCGDPTSADFDPVKYKKLMVAKYEKDQQVAANKREIMHAELLANR